MQNILYILEKRLPLCDITPYSSENKFEFVPFFESRLNGRAVRLAESVLVANQNKALLCMERHICRKYTITYHLSSDIYAGHFLNLFDMYKYHRFQTMFIR